LRKGDPGSISSKRTARTARDAEPRRLPPADPGGVVGIVRPGVVGRLQADDALRGVDGDG